MAGCSAQRCRQSSRRQEGHLGWQAHAATACRLRCCLLPAAAALALALPAASFLRAAGEARRGRVRVTVCLMARSSLLYRRSKPEMKPDTYCSNGQKASRNQDLASSRKDRRGKNCTDRSNSYVSIRSAAATYLVHVLNKLQARLACG